MTPLPKINVKILKKDSLISMANNAIKGGDNYFFRNLYALNEKGEKVDILDGGRNSCAVFVSWSLLALELIKKPHASVDGTERDMINSGWKITDDLRPGAVIIWEAITGEYPLLGHTNVEHRHIGFYIGEETAISNDSKNTGFPQKHHFTFGDTRKIEKIYWHDDLND